MRLIVMPLFLALVGCGTIQKMALKSSTPVFEKSSRSLMKESSWEFFKESAPANIKMMELLWDQDKSNERLLALLVKGYAGYAFAVHETQAFEDELSGVEDSRARKAAIQFYTRALDYGLMYLEKHDLRAEDLLSNDDSKLVRKLKEFDADDVTALLYTAQAWGSLINLQKDNVALVSQVPKVKLLFDRVCDIDKQIDQNVCDIFYAQYDASRPKMLGGNPENGEKLFLAAIQRHPKNLLIRTSYIQYFLVPLMDGEKYEKVALALREEFSKWEDLNRDTLENVSSYKGSEELNLFNAVAQKRFLAVEKHKKKIF